MRSRALFVVNPQAGRLQPGAIATVQAILAQRYDLTTIDCSVIPAERLPKLIADQAPSYECVLALGGDGTISVVASGLVHTGIPLGVLPGGSTNHFARLIGMPGALDAAAHALIRPTRVRYLDTGQVNNRVLIYLGGIGIDALIVRDAPQRVKKVLAWLGYIPPGIRHLQSASWQLTITVDGQQFHSRARTALVANGGFLVHPRFRVGQGIRPDDGLLDLCLYAPENLWHWFTLVCWMMLGKIHRSRYVRQFRGREITVVAHPPAPVEVDGDFIGFQPLSVRVCPHSLAVLVPASTQ
ncbi:MAG: hypothetical protein IRY86_08865 [Thermorudis peleae]|nr:hypothetical protein [Thermorudis peleae]